MNKANLMPLYRQVRLARGRRQRAWSLAGTALALALAGAYGWCRSTVAGPPAPAPAELGKAAGELARANGRLTRVRAELRALQQELYSNRAVAEQPDFSLLLGLLSRTVDDQVVLSHCDLVPLDDPTRTWTASATAAPGPRGRAPGGPVALRVAGFGRSQAAVASFVLGLESSGAFDRVTLVHSSGQTVLGRPAAAFQVEGVLLPPTAPAVSQEVAP